ncbi:hypothetical protein DFH09DRAFT_1315390 [Mycena vulgaris]|nr:hypothetical protein DFH09DRAFT_1315390 [Mycena vulgaris]
MVLHGEETGFSNTCRRACDLLAASSHLAEYVRNLRTPLAVVPKEARSLEGVLRAIPNVQRFTIYNLAVITVASSPFPELNYFESSNSLSTSAWPATSPTASPSSCRNFKVIPMIEQITLTFGIMPRIPEVPWALDDPYPLFDTGLMEWRDLPRLRSNVSYGGFVEAMEQKFPGLRGNDMLTFTQKNSSYRYQDHLP